MGEPDQKTCPIVSAFSQVKDATGYPKCITDHCAWWTGSACAMTQVGQALGMMDGSASVLGSSASSIQSALQTIAGKTDLFSDWEIEQGVTRFFKDIVGNADLSSLFTDLREIVRAVADQLTREKVNLGG